MCVVSFRPWDYSCGCRFGFPPGQVVDEVSRSWSEQPRKTIGALLPYHASDQLCGDWLRSQRVPATHCICFIWYLPFFWCMFTSSIASRLTAELPHHNFISKTWSLPCTGDTIPTTLCRNRTTWTFAMIHRNKTLNFVDNVDSTGDRCGYAGQDTWRSARLPSGHLRS